MQKIILPKLIEILETRLNERNRWKQTLSYIPLSSFQIYHTHFYFFYNAFFMFVCIYAYVCDYIAISRWCQLCLCACVVFLWFCVNDCVWVCLFFLSICTNDDFIIARLPARVRVCVCACVCVCVCVIAPVFWNTETIKHAEIICMNELMHSYSNMLVIVLLYFCICLFQARSV